MNKDSDIEIENSRPDLRFYASDQSKARLRQVSQLQDLRMSGLRLILAPLPHGNVSRNEIR